MNEKWRSTWTRIHQYLHARVKICHSQVGTSAVKLSWNPPIMRPETVEGYAINRDGVEVMTVGEWSNHTWLNRFSSYSFHSMNDSFLLHSIVPLIWMVLETALLKLESGIQEVESLLLFCLHKPIDQIVVWAGGRDKRREFDGIWRDATWAN